MTEVIKLGSVRALILAVRAAWERADRKQEDANEWYIKTGKLLIELKGRVRHGEWYLVLRELDRSPRRAQQLMSLAAGGDLALEQFRHDNRMHVRKTRRALEMQSPEQLWQSHIAALCEYIVAMPAHWNTAFPRWREFEVPDRLRELVDEACRVMSTLTTGDEDDQGSR